MHELRTPLTVIEGYAEGLLDSVTQPSQEVFASISDEVAKVKRLVADLQLLSSLEEKPNLVLTNERVHTIVASVATRLRNQFEAKDVQLVQNYEHGISFGPTVLVDKSRVEQVVTNLLGNALTYTLSGGTVTISTHTDHRTGNETLTVHDTGIGIAPEDLPHVFERFYRVSGVTRPPGGSGIGLAIAKALTTQHGGTIAVTSPGPNNGSTFTVRLPRTGPPTGADHPR